jgi:hypothetical protein
MPAPPQPQAAGPSHGIAKWLSQPSRCPGRSSSSLIQFPHHQPPALIIAQLELHNGRGFGRLLIRCLDIAKVLAAVSQDGDAPGPQLGGLLRGWSDNLFRCRGHPLDSGIKAAGRVEVKGLALRWPPRAPQGTRLVRRIFSLDKGGPAHDEDPRPHGLALVDSFSPTNSQFRLGVFASRGRSRSQHPTPCYRKCTRPLVLPSPESRPPIW